ncbi:heavy metal translocating P-type ATPase [Glaciimonas sp. CA11.2]|uniref:heavy metal translocating P-type ATPase n=1 Tax=unclassified Glaciimonas TaxID=2644401 RepID=UPI002AB4356C|nr:MULTISPECIES: heavy metal translocating P-type ATPase [unclassified Glaciimonas]MDY7547112.1 heavy metal translocating P-type ATPase [Glaciimonas sp. CA11.2]MEB0011044.1 heavy metal translocating P-type ATPase [Glaciimonas sp. Cout2]MEB0081279.1 heavy metal translocating P-type ATPase [Glaciimonas sp. Gout2]MEB0162005.1 heavy metal translocating P-type ATPase [Glaciimonas sp. CA11.2]
MGSCQHDHKHAHQHDPERAHSQEHVQDHAELAHECAHAHHDHGPVATSTNGQSVNAPFLSAGAAVGSAEAVFLIQKMDCPTEEKLIRDRFKNMAGIVGMQFNLIQRELTVQHHLDSVASIISSLKALDLDPALKSDTLTGITGLSAELGDGAFKIARSKWLLIGVSGIAAVGSEVVAWTSGNETSWFVIGLALLAIFTGGLDTLKKGWIALRNFSLNMNFLMSLAVIGAAVIGQWPEAAVVIFLFALAEMIEALSLDRARNAIKGLMAMAPDKATVQDAAGSWQEIPTAQVVMAALVRVRPGERVPLDGIVMAGQTTINQAPITGESMPVVKQSGDQVFAGTINERGAFDYKVTALQANSTLSRIIKSVQQAQGQRAPTQRFVDQFAQYYIPAVVLMALLVAVLPPLVLGTAFYPWIYKALVLLVIACPCALVISTPVTVVSGLAAAAKHGLLIKGGVYLEMGRKIKALALDKTGTLTVGKPVVTDTQLAQPQDPTANLIAYQRLAASLSHRSDHPVSTAVAAHWQLTNDVTDLIDVSEFEALTGLGVKGRVEGQLFYLGNHRMVHDMGICSLILEAQLEALEMQGKTTIVLCSATTPLLVLAVADTVRDTSVEAITQLKAIGIAAVILTGDNPHTAQAIGEKVGIADARGNLLPDDKLNAISDLIKRYGMVGMVGDGINDAPALAKANIGFAMGAAGTDTALETADVALMDDDLRKIPDFIRLSKKTHNVLMQNITLALGIKAVFLVLALTGEATLWMAVFADMGASLLVVFNGLRLLRAFR